MPRAGSDGAIYDSATAPSVAFGLGAALRARCDALGPLRGKRIHRPHVIQLPTAALSCKGEEGSGTP
jgi:hypothetical protein